MSRGQVPIVRMYCTYFDRGYLSRGIAMIDSLLHHSPESEVWVLALSDDVAVPLEARYGRRVTTASLATLEDQLEPIAHLRSTRSRSEYIFTLTAAWTRHVMDQRVPEEEWVTYLDADLWFFSPVDSIYQEMDHGSVAVVEHRYPRTRRSLNRYGTYNVGWVSFRNDPDGRRCLAWWDAQCRAWCFDRVEDGKFADQGYLDQFALQTDRLVIVKNPGVDLAPWNLGRHRVSGTPGAPMADGRPVVCFHFHGIRRVGDRYYWKNAYYHGRTTRAVRDLLFRPYLTALSAIDRELGVASAPPRRRQGRGAVVARAREALKSLIAKAVGDTLRAPGPAD